MQQTEHITQTDDILEERIVGIKERDLGIPRLMVAVTKSAFAVARLAVGC